MNNEFMTPLECFDQIKKMRFGIAGEKVKTISLEEIVPTMCKHVEKSLKMLKNLIEENIDLINLKDCFKFYHDNDEAGVEDYNNTKDKRAKELTIEEYKSLKEVLKR